LQADKHIYPQVRGDKVLKESKK